MECFVDVIVQFHCAALDALCEGCLVGNMSETQCAGISQQQVCSGKKLPPPLLVDVMYLATFSVCLSVYLC